MDAPAAPVLTLKSDPVEGVEVYFDSLHVDVERITVWRIADGERQAVSGALKALAAGAFVVTDWHVPFGVASTYVGEVFDDAGASVIGAQSTITVESDVVRFQDASDPTSNVVVELRLPSLFPVSRAPVNRQVWVAGLPRPFNQYWGPGAIERLPLVTWTESDPDAVAMQGINSWMQVLVRTPPSFVTLPRLLFAAVRSFDHEYLVNVQNGAAITWALTVDEVQPLSAAIFRPLVTWQDWMDAFPAADFTWADVMAVYGAGRWIDAIRNPPSA